MVNKNIEKSPKIIQLMAGGSFSACVAEFITIPFDTAKVNLQIANRNFSSQRQYSGFVGFFVKTIKENGLTSLWKGTIPGFYRQILYAGIRLGTYEKSRDFLALKFSKQSNSLKTKPKSKVWQKIAAAFATGTLAITVAQPADLLKIRIQGELLRGNLSKAQYQNGFFNAFFKVVKEEGFFGLWKGLGPNIARNSVINTAELVTYDIFKSIFLSHKILNDNVICHISSALSAGFVGTVVGSPLDVIKTRIMNSNIKRKFFQTAKDIAIKEGAKAFYQGFSSNYVRIGSWNVVMFLTFEQVKKVINKLNSN